MGRAVQQGERDMAHVNWHCVCVKEREKARVTVEVYECVRDVRGNWTGKKKKKREQGEILLI